ncbi:MAG: hypothetical protein V4623_00895 [Pseudomonadota bacterium]
MALFAGLLSACGTTTTGDWPQSGPLIPAGKVQLSPTLSYSFETVASAALFYAIYDPLAPNWSIQERSVDTQTFSLSLRAKRFRTGGDGEAISIFKRRALQLQREKGFASYRIIDFSEGVESSTPWPQRYSQGTIELIAGDRS